MRTRSLFILIMLLLAATSVFADDLGLIRLSLIEGDVQLLIQDTTDWTDATINIPLNEGDRVWVPDDGKAELQVRGGACVRADGDTSLDILTVDHDSAQYYLDRGHIYSNNRQGGIKNIQIDTPLTSIRSYDNSIMMIDVSEDGVTEVSVLKGYVYAESKAGATRVNAGNTLTIRDERNAEIAPISPPDEWEQWNMARDQRLAAWGDSARYLPDDLHEYASDFDDYGRWVYVGDYGYVWSPIVPMSGWAPYTMGSWIWIRGSHVWVDYYPWGWAPSHYGRWIFLASHGWCWVPPAVGAVYWGPGFVGWIVTPTYVAWVPLAPGEIYYGYGYYGPWSVNITSVNINTVVVKRPYVNARVNDAVVVVKRETFGTGKRLPIKVKENPFEVRERGTRQVDFVPPRARPKQPIIIVPPDMRDELRRMRRTEQERMPRQTTETRRITPPAPPSVKPEHREMPETRREVTPVPPSMKPGAPASPPAVRMQPEKQLPPERVRKTRPEEMKNERPMVKRRESSVFRPQQPENLPVKRSNEPKVIQRKQGLQREEQQQMRFQNERREFRRER